MADQTNDPAPAQMSESPANCKYISIGCQWKGTIHEAHEHEEVCAYPEMSGGALMCLSAFQAGTLVIEEKEKFIGKRKIFGPLIDLLEYKSFKSFIFLDLAMTRYLTDDNVQNLWYKTIRFTAFNHQWVVKAKIDKDQIQSCNREINYQLILKTKTSCPLNIHYIAFKDAECGIPAKFDKYDFTDTESKSDFNLLPFPKKSKCPGCNKLLDNCGIIEFRFIMVLL